MKINSPASRQKIRERYGSVREFARQCQEPFGMTELDVSYNMIGKVLTGALGGQERRASIPRAIRLRLEREGLLVFEPDDETDQASNG
jgi:hypothetical protein